MSEYKIRIALQEHEELYSDECANILSKHLRQEMNRYHNVRETRAKWREYLELRSANIKFLQSVGQWNNTGLPVERTRTNPVDEDC